MKLNEFIEQLSKYKEGFTEQPWTMNTYAFSNEYINVIRIDTSTLYG